MMIGRMWGILGLVAWAAFAVASLLGGVSLILCALGLFSGQLAVAGVAELLVSVVFLIAGAGVLFAAARTVRRGSEPLLERLVFALAAIFAGTCWTIIGICGVMRGGVGAGGGW